MFRQIIFSLRTDFFLPVLFYYYTFFSWFPTLIVYRYVDHKTTRRYNKIKRVEVFMNKYLKRTLVVASVMIIIFSIIMLWPLPLRKVLRQETDTAMTVSLSDNDTNISSFSLSASSVEYRRIMEILEDYSYHCTWYSFIPHESFTGHGENLII